MPDLAAAGRYRRLFTLARGGMGRIDVGWRREGRFERVVAIKRLREAFARDEEFVSMFLDEARVAGAVRHPNVVSVLDLGRDAEGLFLVMDLVEGVSLQELLAHASADGGLLSLQLALRILRDVATGLHAAHEAKDLDGAPLHLVHRDVSPPNVIVGYDGITRLTDFGIAKALGARTQTAAGGLKGKLRYMAPEQIELGPIDRRTDLFALGVVTFELVAGHRPFEGTAEEIARAITSGNAPDLGDERPEVPSELVELVFRLLARDPALRPRDADEVRRTLDALLAREVAREGRVEVADHLASAFGDARERLATRILRAARAAREEVGAAARSASAPPSSPDLRSRALAPLLIVLVALAAGLVAGLGGALAPPSRDPPPRAEPASSGDTP